MAVTLRKDGAVGHVVLDAPPVNAIGADMRAGLLQAVAWAQDNGCTRVVLSGAGRGFAAGADAREFDAAPMPPHLPEICDAIEASRVPWIAAIHGAALGGGCELALACRWRVATAEAQIGLPEVTLGVVPGAGGTQRLPRLVGVAAALDLIATGKPVSGARARDLKLVDAVADDPVAAACAVAEAVLARAIPVSRRSTVPVEKSAIETARGMARRKMTGQVAPLAAIDLVEAAQTAPYADAMAQERKTFLTLRQGAQARALRHVFFAERAAKAPDRLRGQEVALNHVAIVGGGTMGAGIAHAALSADLSVTLLETDAQGVARAQTHVAGLIDKAVARGVLDAGRAAAAHAALNVTHDFDQAANATLAIEAAFEDMAVKHQVLGKLQAVLPAQAVLATNTSYLDIDDMARGLDDPTRLVGLHFFAPAHIMKLLEIVQGAVTSDRALATGFALARRLRKIPVLAGVCDGFIGNRILARYREAADTLLLDGALPEQVDAAMRAFGYPMGPYEAQDLSGLDIAHANRRRQDATRDPNRRYVSTVGDRLVALGRLGRKTGQGWYAYPDGTPVPDPAVAALVRDEAAQAGAHRRDFDDADIVQRLTLAMINEAAAILGEGIARSATDIDLVQVHGYGFPRWRGGLMHHADTLGVRNLLTQLHALCAEDPVTWRPARVIDTCAARGIALADWRG